ncbi:universal stress protein, partial [Pseudomonas sp. 30_B]|uniref:universal stress protein n=1 Tax=Pseudomonas sp. 30_B TaxID=2813575 RepID=UPI001A9EF06A
MSYKSILVHLDTSDRARARLETALTLARQFGAYLSAVFAVYTPEPTSFYVMAGTADYFADQQRRRDEKRAQAEQILRARLAYQGTQLVFSTARGDDLWWLMTSNETNAARLALAFAGEAGWKDEMPRVAAGLLALQKNGAWQTTTANALGLLALERFSRTYERAPVAGATKIALGGDTRSIAWSQP